MPTRRCCAVVSSVLCLATCLSQTAWSRARERTVASQERRASFNDGWLFHKGEAPDAERVDFEDRGWRALALPHDWAIEGPFDRGINPHCGALPFFGVGWYRKHFVLPGSAKGHQVSVEFDGAMANSRVWINGHDLGGRPYGYIGFGFDLTPHLRWDGQDNVLAVRLAPENESSRWYPGAGLYRNVWLDVTGTLRVARWGTYVTTPAVSDEKATVLVRTTIENKDALPAQAEVQSIILDASGREVARATARKRVTPGQPETVSQELVVLRPERWDVAHPYLYKVATDLSAGKTRYGRWVTPFGIRRIEFDRAQGFLLNGRHLKMQGVCLHHDLGALGTAVNRRAIERQLEILRGAGVNAIRTSHNPPAPELLELADQMGFVVMDEAFDMWGKVKVANGHGKYFGEWGERDLADMIRRDRNHPSVVLWSIGNEILEQREADGWKVAQRLTEVCHAEDPTRPVTAGFNQSTNAIKNGLADQVDIPGFNYRPWEYEQILKEHPGWVIVASETSSCVSSRGVYHLPIEKYKKHPSRELTSYDVIAPDWAYAPDVELAAQEKLPQVLGEFVWTGFDYLGEPTPYYGWREEPDENDWPARSSYFGFVDLAGFPKDRYYLYQSVWTQAPMVHILPHWNWAGHEGQAIPVLAYSNADEVELFLNGRSLGRKQRGSEPMVIPVGPNASADRTFRTKYRLEWQVPYEPGTLRAVAYRAGIAVATQGVRTAGAAARVRLMPDRARLRADGSDLSFITVRIEDENGNLCPLADNLVRFSLEGAGRIAGVDNGDPATVAPFQADQRRAFGGLCLVIVRPLRGPAGTIQVTATSDGLAPTQTTLATVTD